MFLQNIRKEIVLRPGCEDICWGLNRKILNVHQKIFAWHRKLKPAATHISIYSGTSQTKAHNTHLCSRAFDKKEEEEAEKVLWLGSNSWCVRPAHPAQVRRETLEVEGKKFPLFLQQEATLRRNRSSSSAEMAQLGTSSVHKIPPRWHKWISTSSTTGQDGFQSDKISNVLRALSHCPLALL